MSAAASLTKTHRIYWRALSDKVTALATFLAPAAVRASQSIVHGTFG